MKARKKKIRVWLQTNWIKILRGNYGKLDQHCSKKSQWKNLVEAYINGGCLWMMLMIINEADD